MIPSTGRTLAQPTSHSNVDIGCANTTFSPEESTFLMHALEIKHCFNCNATSTPQQVFPEFPDLARALSAAL